MCSIHIHVVGTKGLDPVALSSATSTRWMAVLRLLVGSLTLQLCATPLPSAVAAVYRAFPFALNCGFQRVLLQDVLFLIDCIGTL